MDAFLNRKICKVDDRVEELKFAIQLLCDYILENTTLKKGIGKAELKRQLDVIKELGKYKLGSSIGPF